MKTDVEIAQGAKMLPIEQIAAKLDIPAEDVEQYGKYKAKINPKTAARRGKDGKLILVTAINPTPAGEGKTTTSIGLADAMSKMGKKVALALREPSLGPCFGLKGGAAGGGYAQVVPMEDINLHFTGDFHAVTTAHNLLAAVLDNHIHHGNELNIDTRRILWKRVLDINDRALRRVVVGLGGKAHGVPRESGFDITVAGEMMAILCLAENLTDMKRRMGRIIVAYTADGRAVRADELNVTGALALLFKDAIKPNLVQTLEGTPAFIHGGPFANIAHGCNSVIATKTALSLADYTVTEAGFGADLGAEKFLDIKCRLAGLKPDAVVIVATVRALKMHGGLRKEELTKEDMTALAAGFGNLAKHIDSIKQYNLPAVVAVNVFPTDSEAELNYVREQCAALGVDCAVSTVWADGGNGGKELAEKVLAATEKTSDFRVLYEDELPLAEKINVIARKIYGAAGVDFTDAAKKELEDVAALGGDKLPVCMAKTQYSLSDDPKKIGRPRDFRLTVRSVRLSAGAGFVVALTGDILTMPGLPKKPAAENMDIDENGVITGLF